MRLVWGSVTEILFEHEQLQQLEVSLDDGTEGRAICYPDLAGRCAQDERVLLNTTAVDLALGTGGSHFVVARLAEGGGEVLNAPSGGHIMKLRYSPMQLDVLAVEEQDSPQHEAMRRATSLDDMPVACCGLHSQVPLVAGAAKEQNADLRIAYVMTDEAALALPLSGVMRDAVEAGLVDATITCGQAFGGEFEAVNLYSGLLAARHVAQADVAIVAIGPGVVGTATPFGHGGVAQGAAINAVAALDGQPVAVLRLSFADTRPRHWGVSHHTITALSRVALGSSFVAVPRLDADQMKAVEHALESGGVWETHRRVDTGGREPDMRGLSITTMGRGLDDDPAFFAAAWAAGEACAAIASDSTDGGP